MPCHQSKHSNEGVVEELSREVQVLLPHTACWHDQLPNRGSEGCCQHSPYYFSIWRTDTPCQRVTWTPVSTHCRIISKNHNTRRKRYTEFYSKPAIEFIVKKKYGGQCPVNGLVEISCVAHTMCLYMPTLVRSYLPLLLPPSWILFCSSLMV